MAEDHEHVPRPSVSPTGEEPTHDRRPLQTLAYAAVASPIIVGVAAAVGVAIRGVDPRFALPVQLGVALLLIVVAGLGAHYVMRWFAVPGRSR